MGVLINLAKQRFGRLTVERQNGLSERGEALWLCECECGNMVCVTGFHLRDGHTRSCGCLQREVTYRRNISHGMSKTSVYRAWKSMRGRCHNKKHKYYYHYGGRGIKVCKRWGKFENFYIDMGERPKGMTLDRKDNSKGYSPTNCRWASWRTQQNNRRNNHLITFQGRTQTIAQWGREIGIAYSALWIRISKLKWSVERALTEPVNK